MSDRFPLGYLFNKFDIFNICIPIQKVEEEESSIVKWV